MKAIVCEMCGSNDLIKQEGCFVCQNCGTKYSVEEAKKMMLEGTIDVTGTVKIDNTNQIKNYLDLSNNAYESGNGQSAFDYANKALEIQPQNSKAWIAKMKSIEYIGTLGDLKLKEVVEAGKNAVNYATENQKNEIINEVYHYELTRALSLLKLAMNKMLDTADIEQTFKRFAMISIFTASANALQVDSKIVNIYDKIADEAMEMVKLIPDEVLFEDSNLAKIVGECAKQYQFETDALIKRYKIYGAELTDEAKKKRDVNKTILEDKAENAMKIALEKETNERRAKRDAYWEKHKEEKDRLENEKFELQKKKDVYYQEKDAIPENKKVKDLTQQLSIKENEKKGLGLFKIKEKSKLDEDIKALTKEIDELKLSSKGKNDEIDKKINECLEKIRNIEDELTKDR